MILSSEDVHPNRLEIQATKPESQSNYCKATDINNSIMVKEKKKYILFITLMKKKNTKTLSNAKCRTIYQ